MPRKLPPPLPGPVLQIIFQNLSPQERRNCRRVCKLWKQVITFYDLLPDVADFFVDCQALVKRSPKRSLLKFIRPGPTPPATSNPTFAFLSLQRNYLENCAYYFLRPQLHARIRGFEEMTNFGSFIWSLRILPVLKTISTLDLESLDKTKFSKMNLDHFEVLISHFPSLKRLTLPFQLMTVFDPDKCRWHHPGQAKGLFPKLESLQIQIPTLSILENDGQESIPLITNLAIFLASDSLKSLQHLTLNFDPYTPKHKNKSLKSPEIKTFFTDITKLITVLGNDLSNNLTAMVMSPFRLTTFTLSTIPVKAFDNTGFLAFFAYLSMRGLKRASLSLTSSTLETSLPTIIHMMMNRGCEIDLDLEFYLEGTESQLATQYLLSLPEVCESLTSLTIRFLGDYDQHNHMFFLEDFIPTKTRLNPAEGPVDFKKMTTFKIRFERPTSKVFLTFGWLRGIWNNVRHISIIVGRLETYESERGIGWALLKDKWKGRRSTSISNIFYLRGILKFFPQLWTLVFWADLSKANDIIFLSQPAVEGLPCERGSVAQCVPELKEISLRGLGPNVSNDCVRGFYGMKGLTSLELIGNHSINNAAKSQLLEETPSLERIKFKL